MSGVGDVFWSGGNEYAFYPSALSGKTFHLVTWDVFRNISVGVEGATDLTLEEAKRIQKLMEDNSTRS